MSNVHLVGLDSSYIWSLTSQLGVEQDASDQMTGHLGEFKLPDEDLLIDKPGPLSKEDDSIKAITDDYLSDNGEIYWPSYRKDAKLHWSTDKEKITDFVRIIFAEKFKIYKQKSTKDLNTDTKGSTPQPLPIANPTDENANFPGGFSVSSGSNRTRHSVVYPMEDEDELPADLHTQVDMVTAKREADGEREADPRQEAITTSEADRDSSNHVLTSRARHSARSSLIQRASDQSPPPSPPANEDSNLNEPYSFPSEFSYRRGISDALERSRGRGEPSLTGAIHFVRATLNETPVRHAISSASSAKKVGTVRLTQINERIMSWIFEKLDGSCMWVKPYKGKVINGVVRYSGWTGEDGLFTDYPVIYGIFPKDPTTPAKLAAQESSAVVKRSAPRLSGTKMVNLKIGKRHAEGKVDSPSSASNSEFPSYVQGESWTMERAKAAIKMGRMSKPPCGFCTDAGYDCMIADRGRTCAFCIAANRSAPDCEGSRPTLGIEAMDYEQTAPSQPGDSPNAPPVLTHSGRVSKRPTRANYVDRSENDSDSALSLVEAEEPVASQTQGSLRRKSSAMGSTPSLKRQRPDSFTAGSGDHDHQPVSDSFPRESVPSSAAPVTGAAAATAPASNRKIRSPEVWFYFTPSTLSNPDLQSKVRGAKEVTSVHAFFDAALKAWKMFGGSSEPNFAGVDVSWPERKMLVEWRDERDWERMMTMLGRAHGDQHGEVEVVVKYRLAG